MITSYDILVPSFVQSNEPFEVRVVARDGSGAIVDDNSTLVTLSSSSPDIQFDSDGDLIFGELGDEQAVLISGIINLLSLDTKGTSFTVTATATVGGINASLDIPYNFNCINFQSFSVVTPELSTTEHQRFLRGYGTVAVLVDPTVNTVELSSAEFLAYSGVS